METAKAQDCDLIVMGSRGLSISAGLLLGSATHKVLQLAHIAVLVARGPKVAEAVKEPVAAGQATRS